MCCLLPFAQNAQQQKHFSFKDVAGPGFVEFAAGLAVGWAEAFQDGCGPWGQCYPLNLPLPPL